MIQSVHIPPSEIEIAEICAAEAALGKSNVIRRLAFQRDTLKRELGEVQEHFAALVSSISEQPICDHPWHANPALLVSCPECGATGNEDPNLVGRRY